MAMSHITASNVPKTLIEGIQTVPPFTVTDPRQVRRVLAAKEPIPSAIFTGCFNIVLCYNKATDKDSGWVVAGWIKESLARALKEQPLLAGRLRRGEDGRGELEIVSNDSGVRLVEATISMSLKEFLDLQGRYKAEGEAELVFWKNIDEQNPRFSPLFYVQVTNFECGGYSIGISCSILLADLVIMDKFVETWAKIQNKMVSKNEESNLPIFYLPHLKPLDISINGTFSSTPVDNFGQTVMIFKTSKENMNLEEESSKKLALLCIEEAEQNLGTKMSLDELILLVRESTDVIKVENCKKKETVNFNLEGQFVSSANLKEYSKMSELAFREGNKAIGLSLWIGSVSDGFVMGIPFYEEGTSEFNIIVTFPCEK